MQNPVDEVKAQVPEPELTVDETLESLKAIVANCDKATQRLYYNCDALARPAKDPKTGALVINPDLPEEVVASFEAADEALDELWQFFVDIGAIGDEEEDEDESGSDSSEGEGEVESPEETEEPETPEEPSDAGEV